MLDHADNEYKTYFGSSLFAFVRCRKNIELCASFRQRTLVDINSSQIYINPASSPEIETCWLDFGLYGGRRNESFELVGNCVLAWLFQWLTGAIIAVDVTLWPNNSQLMQLLDVPHRVRKDRKDHAKL